MDVFDYNITDKLISNNRVPLYILLSTGTPCWAKRLNRDSRDNVHTGSRYATTYMNINSTLYFFTYLSDNSILVFFVVQSKKKNQTCVQSKKIEGKLTSRFKHTLLKIKLIKKVSKSIYFAITTNDILIVSLIISVGRKIRPNLIFAHRAINCNYLGKFLYCIFTTCFSCIDLQLCIVAIAESVNQKFLEENLDKLLCHFSFIVIRIQQYKEVIKQSQNSLLFTFSSRFSLVSIFSFLMLS